MILLRNLVLARGGRVLLEQVNLQLHPGQKVGVVGANGCGKSSLFALLRGELHQEAGDLELPPDWVIAHVGQETPALPQPAIDYVLDGDAELRQVERELAAAEAAHDGERLALLHERMEHIGGYGARARAAALLSGLGFADAEFDQPVAQFSGGWRVRLNLARALMCRSDLLLDEPTNHLDLEMRHALTLALQEYEGAVVLVSHDRHLLRTTADALYLAADGRVQPFDGDLDAYRDWLAASRNAQTAAASDGRKEARRRSRAQEAAQRQAALESRRALQKEVQQLEQKLESWQAEQRLLESRLADPTLYGAQDKGPLQDLLRRQAQLLAAIEQAEERWLEIHSQLESEP
ncbi:MAG: ATP-binding cassette domain-containing protein [Pseudomonadota bacterium]